MRKTELRTGLALAALALAGCSAQADGAGRCDLSDAALKDAAFVIATEPAAGAAVASGFAVKGCSRTFESNVNWRLTARNGQVLASGHTSGGGVDGPGTFGFSVPYSVDARQVGTLEVFEEDTSGGEGFPPGRTVLPLVLAP